MRRIRFFAAPVFPAPPAHAGRAAAGFLKPDITGILAQVAAGRPFPGD